MSLSPMDLRTVLFEIQAALRDAGIDHALIGGLAMAAHGSARATVDLDLLADGRRSDDVDQGRIREYFRVFDREKELDALLAARPPA